MRLFRALALGAALVSTAGCADRQRDTPLPEGLLIVARAPALARVLEALAESPGTPIASESTALLHHLPDCEIVEARAPAKRPSALSSSVRCAETAGPLALLHALRVEASPADLAFAFPLGDERILGTARVSDGGEVVLDLRVPDAAFAGARALFAPGDEAPGPPLLSSRDTLLHARLRPRDGVNIARLVPDASQGALLFRLKSQLFAGAVLDGTWESAVYLAHERGRMPHAAVALGFSNRSAAVGAMEAFIADLQDSWPIRRAAFRTGQHEGACLPGVRLLPELAPCYVATDRALIVGWNPASVEAALAPEADSPDLGAEGGLVIHLERLPDARIRLDGRFDENVDAPAPAWRRLAAQGQSGVNEVRIRVTLEGDA